MKRTLVILAICCSVVAAWAQDKTAAPAGKTIVFVHGAWGGGWDYKPLQQMLAAKGREAYRVTLTGLGERAHLGGAEVNLDTHIMDVVNVLKFEELTDVILVGHSYGGMVITGVAHRVPERIAHLVYMDAMLPEDGESVLSLMPEDRRTAFLKDVGERGEGWKVVPFWPGWESTRDVPHPAGTFKQPIKLGNPAAEKIPATYVLTIDEGATTDSFSKYAERAKARGWNYREWIADHNTQRSKRDEYVALLLSIE